MNITQSVLNNYNVIGLSKLQRDVLFHREQANMTYSEIGIAVNKSPETVSAIYDRSIRLIQMFFEKTAKAQKKYRLVNYPELATMEIGVLRGIIDGGPISWDEINRCDIEQAQMGGFGQVKRAELLRKFDEAMGVGGQND